MKRTLACLALCTLSSLAFGEVQTKVIHYEHEGTPLTGYLYWDDASTEKRPGVLVIHEWWGLNDYAKSRAKKLAELGYVSFAADLYGDGRVTERPAQAQEWMLEITADVEFWRERAALGLAQLRKSELVDADKLAAIGYCFGGGSVLQMAYGGAPVRGVVSFHGSLPAAPAERKGKITSKILVLHGYADRFLSPELVADFQAKLEAAGADWEMDSYGGVRHSFTNPQAGKFGIENLRYDPQADARSWQRMQAFFREIFEE